MRGQKRERERGEVQQPRGSYLDCANQSQEFSVESLRALSLSLFLSLSFRPNALFLYIFYFPWRLPSACVSTRLSFIPPPGELDVKLCLSLPFRSND